MSLPALAHGRSAALSLPRRAHTTKLLAPRNTCHARLFTQVSPASAPAWRPSSVLDEWVQREARPISLRQLTFFGARLTEARLLGSANYVRTELPTRLAHRLRDMQTLPYFVVTNPHISHVYELYYRAFEKYRRLPEIKTLEDNDRFCRVIKDTLDEHLTVIPRLAIGVLEVQGSMRPEETDNFMTTLLRSRISRRTIAEQHLALTDTFHSPWHFPDAKFQMDPHNDHVGEIFLKCNAQKIVEQCGETTKDLMRQTYGPSIPLPKIVVYGHIGAKFPYILSHLEYIVGELLRNSIQAVIEQGKNKTTPPPPIEVLICETHQHVIIRISDQGGGVPKDVLPYLWSFSKGPRSKMRRENLSRVPRLAATMKEVKPSKSRVEGEHRDSSLESLTTRPPDLRLGIGLPMSRIYAEYWAGSLELHSLEGYGVDVFLQIPKLGNKNEKLTTRASMDAV